MPVQRKISKTMKTKEKGRKNRPPLNVRVIKSNPMRFYKLSIDEYREQLRKAFNDFINELEEL